MIKIAPHPHEGDGPAIVRVFLRVALELIAATTRAAALLFLSVYLVRRVGVVQLHRPVATSSSSAEQAFAFGPRHAGL
jgi:hypothetical protein